MKQSKWGATTALCLPIFQQWGIENAFGVKHRRYACEG